MAHAGQRSIVQSRYRVMSVRGIPLYLQSSLLWTVGLLLIFLFVSNRDATEAMSTVTAAALTLVSVVIHEYGHALAGRALGVSVTDVVIHVFFGMTRMEQPGTPRREMLIGVAGPAANLVVAGALYPWTRDPEHWDGLLPQSMIATLFVVNVVLGTVNLIPAFPMDGGRILRAALTGPLGEVNATRVAVAIGRFVGIMAIVSPLIVGVYRWSVALPIAGFVLLYLGESETRRVALRAEDQRVHRWLEDVSRMSDLAADPHDANTPDEDEDPTAPLADE